MISDVAPLEQSDGDPGEQQICDVSLGQQLVDQFDKEHRKLGGLTIELSLDGFPDASYVRHQVQDRERAFDPFYSTKASGSGLGLAITRQILEDHGGSVCFEPVDSGARLVITLPT